MPSIKKPTKRSLTSEMERKVKQMLKLIEEDGDSFAQKAEMYYQKRPELITLVEEFYRGYRSLAERYEHVTVDSDNVSEPTYWASPSPRKMGRRISGNRAPGFDVFLGSSGNNGGEVSSSLTDSDEEFDDASSSYSGFFGNACDHGVNKRVVELEMELKEVKEKLCMYEEDAAKVHAYEQEVRNLNEKLRLSEEEFNKLEIELGKYKTLESESAHLHNDVELSLNEKVESFGASKSNESIENLLDQLNLAHKEIITWKTRFNSQQRENSKLQERIARLKVSLVDRDHEMRDLKVVLSKTEEKHFFEKAQIKSHLEEEIRKIQCEKIEMEKTLKGEIEILKEDIEDRKNNIKDFNASLDALRLERDNLNEEVGSLKEETISRDNQIENMNMQFTKLQMEHMQMSAGIEEAHRHVGGLKLRVEELEEVIERQKIEILEGAEEKREAIRQLCFSLEYYRNGYNMLRQAFMGHKRFPILAA